MYILDVAVHSGALAASAKPYRFYSSGLPRSMCRVLLTLDATAMCYYRETMKNITVSLDDETYRRARITAAQRDTSVSALVKQFLRDLTEGETEFERLKREECELREQIKNFSASENIPRDELYDRRF